MADLKDARDPPEEQLWEELADVRADMLGVAGSGQHLQPLAPQLDRAPNRIWCVARKSSDLVEALDGGKPAQFCIIGEDQDYYACLSGELR